MFVILGFLKLITMLPMYTGVSTGFKKQVKE